MSADNWTVCPQCKIKYLENIGEKQHKVSDSYGKVSPDKYLEMVKSIENPEPLENTLREDYSQGIDRDGEYSCSYRASCECGFSFSYNTKVESEDVLKSPLNKSK